MPDYKNGKIYILFNNHNSKYYIGSTTQILCKRKSGYKKCKVGNISKEIKKIGWLDNNGKQNWSIRLIKKFPCNDKSELEVEEGKHQIEAFKKEPELVLNNNIAGRTKEYWKEYNKKYCEENKEKIKISKKKWREENKEKVKLYREENKEEISKKSKKYYAIPEVKLRKKIYREENKEKIKKRNSEKIKCDCGLIITRGNLPRHKRTPKHKKYLDSLTT